MDQKLLESLPDEVFHLGNPREVFRCGHLETVALMAFGGLLVLVGGALTLFLTVVVRKPLVALLGLIPVGLGVLVFRRARGIYGLYVLVLDEALVRISGKSVDVCRWDRIQSVWETITEHYVHHVYVGSSYEYVVRCDDGRRFVFSRSRGTAKIRQLGQVIQAETGRFLFPLALAQYQNGEPVAFGKVAVSERGLTHGKATLPWEELAKIEIKHGNLVVSKKGKWFSWCKVPSAGIPNLHVLLALVSHAALAAPPQDPAR